MATGICREMNKGKWAKNLKIKSWKKNQDNKGAQIEEDYLWPKIVQKLSDATWLGLELSYRMTRFYC